MKCDIGHFEIKAEGRCYNLIPSFENIMKLGDGEELIDHYGVLHGMKEYPQNQKAAQDFYMYTVGLSADVLRACSDIDIDNLVIDVVERNEVFRLKKSLGTQLTPDRQIIMAAGLMRHGISGVNKSKKQSSGKAADTIDLWVPIHILMGKMFGISKKDALGMTMTEFNMLYDSNYPPEKTVIDVISDDEYDAAMANLAAINKIRDAK